MIDRIQEVAQNCGVLRTDKHSYVFEDGKGKFVLAKEKYHLHIENQTNKSFLFVQNDDCVMKKIKGGQCDYLVCNNHKLYFVEVKDASGNISAHKRKAYKQIVNSYKYYSTKIIFSDEDNLNAIVCFPISNKIIRTSDSSKKKEFSLNYNINLQIGNYILFD